MRKKALHRFATEDLRSLWLFDMCKFAEILEAWRDDPCTEPVTEYYANHLPVEKQEEFEKRFKSPSWAAYALPRYMLKEWCTQHGYDFPTLCRIIDDDELHV